MSIATLLRIVQVVVVLMICPMVALGVMSSLSGGGMTPAYQIIGGRLVSWSFLIVIPLLLASEAVHRWLKLTPLAILVCLVPFGVWAWLLVALERETGFFSGG